MASATIARRPITRKEYLDLLRATLKKQNPVNFTAIKMVSLNSPVAGRA